MAREQRSLSQVGPFPYQASGITECSNCGLLTSADSEFCGQCGQALGGPGYRWREGDVIQCATCQNWNQNTALFCRTCGHSIPRQAYVEHKVETWSTPSVHVVSDGSTPAVNASSSSGRLPKKTGPLKPINLPDREDYSRFDRLGAAVARAGELYERTRDDLETLQWRASEQRKWIDENFLNERVMDPQTRHEYVEALGIIAAADEALDRYKDAKSRYYRLLAEFSEAERLATMDMSPPFKRNANTLEEMPLGYYERRAEKAERDKKGNRGGREWNFPPGGLGE